MATSRICSVPDCGKKHFGRGWCNAHYWLWRKHGDPHGGGTKFGEPEKFYRQVVLTYEGDGCLPWPYGRTCHGYGRMRDRGIHKIVSRMVCEHVNGPPPTPKHEAAHSCGKGHEGCVTKRHLSWKTCLENKSDMIAHGTRPRGEKQGGAKLTRLDILKIRAGQGVTTQRELAKLFGVSQSNISLIQKGTSWAWF